MIDILNFPKEILYTNYNAGSFKHIAQLMCALNLDQNDTTVTIKSEDTFPETTSIILSGQGWLLHLKFEEVTIPEYWRTHAKYKYKCVCTMVEQSFK